MALPATPSPELRVQRALARFESAYPGLRGFQLAVQLEGPRGLLVVRPARGRWRGAAALLVTRHGALLAAERPAGLTAAETLAFDDLMMELRDSLRPRPASKAPRAPLRMPPAPGATPAPTAAPARAQGPEALPAPGENLKSPDAVAPAGAALADRKQAFAERALADAQLDEPALLGLDVAIAVGERLLARSGRGDLRPRADLVFDRDGSLLLMQLPPKPTPDQERALVRLTLALQRALRHPTPARRERAAE